VPKVKDFQPLPLASSSDVSWGWLRTSTVARVGPIGGTFGRPIPRGPSTGVGWFRAIGSAVVSHAFLLVRPYDGLAVATGRKTTLMLVRSESRRLDDGQGR